MNYQPELFASYPIAIDQQHSRANARTNDPETSHVAAQSIMPMAITKTKSAILDVLTRYGPMSDSWIHKYVEQDWHTVSASGCRTRRASLVHDHCLVEDSGARIKLPSGCSAIVWRIKK